ncbi:MAG: hypothetical protein ABUS49_05515 [Acidobacteriota bacterium]
MRTIAALSLCLLGAGGANAQQSSGVRLYEPLSPTERWEWFATSTAGPVTLLGGLFSSGLLTLRNQPPEYGPHWEGYAKRNGLRLTGNAAANGLEAGIGAYLGEDPRYLRVPGKPFGARIANALRMTVMAYDRNGREVPNYARFIAVPAGSALSNAWQPDSQVTASATFSRVGLGFLGQAISNTFTEFWPDVRKHIGHRSTGGSLTVSPDSGR